MAPSRPRKPSADLPIEVDDDLPVWKHAQVVAQLGAVPHHALLLRAGKTALVQLDQAVNVGDLRQAQRRQAAARPELLRIHLA